MANGVAMVVIGEAEVPATALGFTAAPHGPRVAGNRSAALYEAVAEISGVTGAPVVEQLFHPGGQVWYEERRPAFAPSAIPQERPWLLPLTLSPRDIAGVVQAFGEAAAEACAHGVDGIEVKADQGKLHHQFLSRRYNLRSDEYGGTFQRRLRFLSDTLTEIRSNAPTIRALGIRLPGSIVLSDQPSARDAWGEDLSIEECLDVATALAEMKLIDYVSISGDTNSWVKGYWRGHGDETIPERTFRATGRAFKLATSLPVLLAGRILTVGDGEALLDAGDCDMVGMARALIADAQLLVKSGFAGSAHLIIEPVRPCLSCNISCVGSTWYGGEIRCIYDPLSGREAQFTAQPRRKCRIAVCGAGPAGMEFARVAATLGSAVTVFERSDEIGGRLRVWSRLPSRQRFQKAIQFWKECLEVYDGIEVRLGQSAPPVEELSRTFDFVIVATGGEEVLPAWAQVEGPIKNWTVSQAVERAGELADRHVVVFEANRYADPLGVATLLAQERANVVVACPFSESGLALDPVSLACRLSDLDALQVPIHLWTDVRPTNTGEVWFWNHAFDRYRQVPNISDIVWCINPLSRNESAAHNVFHIGDAAATTGLESSTKQAHDLAQALLCSI